MADDRCMRRVPQRHRFAVPHPAITAGWCQLPEGHEGPCEGVPGRAPARSRFDKGMKKSP